MHLYDNWITLLFSISIEYIQLLLCKIKECLQNTKLSRNPIYIFRRNNNGMIYLIYYNVIFASRKHAQFSIYIKKEDRNENLLNLHRFWLKSYVFRIKSNYYNSLSKRIKYVIFNITFFLFSKLRDAVLNKLTELYS